MWGNDTNLYRSAANTLKTDDSLIVAIDLDVDGTTNLDAVDIDGTLTTTGDVTLGDATGNIITLGHALAYIMPIARFNYHINPYQSSTHDLGSSTYRWRNVYTTDLQLSNMDLEEGNKVDGTKGDWTLQEGEEDLFVINNVSGKKYKIALIPTEDT